MREKRATRSDKYQYLIREIIAGDTFWNLIESTESLTDFLNPWNNRKELILQEYDKLKDILFNIADETFTPHQKQVFQLFIDGYNQIEMAKHLNCCQASINKCLRGGTTYQGDQKKTYGGIILKLQKAVAKRDEVKDILSRIKELTDE